MINVEGENHDCEPLRDFKAINDVGYVFKPLGRTWFVSDGEDTIHGINYCPFCGKWLYEGVGKISFNDYLQK